MIKVLVTGSTGFVGRNLIPYLLEKGEYKIYRIDRGRQLKTIPGVETFLWTELQALEGVVFDVIIHLAGKAHDTQGSSEEEQYDKINFGLTREIFDFFVASKSTKFIYLSSVKAAADAVEGPLTEEAITLPATAYGISKLKGEKYIQSKELSAHQYYYILRPCMIHGPENKGNLNLLYKFVKNGIPYPLGAYENRRSFLSIENLLFILDALCTGSLGSGIYNLADSVPLSTNEVVSLMARSLGKAKYRQWPINKSVIRFVAKLGDFFPLYLNSERLQKLTESYLVSNDKIRKSLSQEFPISSQEGLMKTFEHFR